MRLILSVSLALSFSIFQGALAASDMDVTASTQLRLLELKYFEHTFDDETSEERVERIEKLVTGDVGSGSPQDRVKQIAATLQADGESLTPAAPAAPEAKAPANKVASQPAAPAQPVPGANDTGNYPHVNNLEKEILGQEFAGQPLATRIARLETKAFGKPSNVGDLSSRTDRLEEYAERSLHARPFAFNPDIDKPYVMQASPPSYIQQEMGGNLMPGVGVPVSPQQAFDHCFGANRRLAEDFGSTPADTAQLAQQDDPEIYEKTPPQPSARMSTRVGWCEVQIFGHTFPNMHLTKRLRQLNDEVRPRTPKQTDMQLMDDLDPIVAAVLAKKSGQQISSGGAGQTR